MQYRVPINYTFSLNKVIHFKTLCSSGQKSTSVLLRYMLLGCECMMSRYVELSLLQLALSKEKPFHFRNLAYWSVRNIAIEKLLSIFSLITFVNLCASASFQVSRSGACLCHAQRLGFSKITPAVNWTGTVSPQEFGQAIPHPNSKIQLGYIFVCWPSLVSPCKLTCFYSYPSGIAQPQSTCWASDASPQCPATVMPSLQAQAKLRQQTSHSRSSYLSHYYNPNSMQSIWTMDQPTHIHNLKLTKLEQQ